MPSTTLQSNIPALVATLPTVKEAMLAKRGLRALRDRLLYQHDGSEITMTDEAGLRQLGISELVWRWMQSAEGRDIFTDLKEGEPEAVLKAFDAAIKEAITIKLTLAYSPSIDDLVRFHTWFSATTGKSVLMDVTYDPSLLAGFTAMAGSKFVDASITQKLPELEKAVVAQFAQL